MNFKIDAKVGVDNSGQIDYIEICNTKTNNMYCYDVTVSKNVNEADRCSFTMLKQCPGYNQLYVLGTAIRVSVENLDGTAWLPIFLGRVVSVRTDFVFQQTIDCDGALSWLNDIVVRPHLWYVGVAITVQDASAPGGSKIVTQYVQRNVVPSEMFSYISANYDQRRSSERKIGVGSISPNLMFARDGSGEGEQYKENYVFEGATGYDTALSWMGKFCELDSSAMYYAVPANDGWEASVIFISALDTFGMSGLPEISYAQNLIDMEMNQDGSGFYTSVIGLGSNKTRINDRVFPDPEDPTYSEVGGESDHIDNSGTAYYGVIEKVEDFNGKVGVGLFEATYEYAQFGCGNSEGFTVEAIDPLFQNGLMLSLGDHVKLIDAVHMGQTRPAMECIITSTNIQLDKPGSSSYTFFPCGSAFRVSKAKPLSQMIVEGGSVISKSEYLSEQRPIAFDIIGDDSVIASYTDGRQDMYQLVADPEHDGQYKYVKTVGGTILE